MSKTEAIPVEDSGNRDHRGQFKKGFSGNPAGSSAQSKRLRELRDEARKMTIRGIRSVGAKAARGDTLALRAIADIALPKAKPERVAQVIEGIDPATMGPIECAEKAAAMAVSGELPADVAQEVVAMYVNINDARMRDDLDELRKRLEALENE